MIADKHIMAGMRVWPEDIHMGTYYGWIKPIKNLMDSNRISLVLAEAQSLENFPSYETCYDETRRLRDKLKKFLPEADIYVETEQPNFDLYTLQSVPLFSASHYRRLGPFKSTMIGNDDLNFLKAIYPCMMVANILEHQPDYVLAKSGNQSPHIDVINDIIRVGSKVYNWPRIKAQVLEKQDIYVPDLNGNTHMRRSDPEMCVRVESNMPPKDIQAVLGRASIPGFQGPEGLSSCMTIAPMWKAVTGETAPESLKSCFNRHTNCQKCIFDLSERIHVDLKL